MRRLASYGGSYQKCCEDMFVILFDLVVNTSTFNYSTVAFGDELLGECMISDDYRCRLLEHQSIDRRLSHQTSTDEGQVVLEAVRNTSGRK